ncbi:unnamed protein product [Gemmata massiliana]|uniref:Uncharacterized protein n=1 Tax=Gemmata massiliana TaxID=1210884 RepID=A0A6P2D7V2_9BACT|nr:unnamed protein product [Gemmata massiliana]
MGSPRRLAHEAAGPAITHDLTPERIERPHCDRRADCTNRRSRPHPVRRYSAQPHDPPVPLSGVPRPQKAVPTRGRGRPAPVRVRVRRRRPDRAPAMCRAGAFAPRYLALGVGRRAAHILGSVGLGGATVRVALRGGWARRPGTERQSGPWARRCPVRGRASRVIGPGGSGARTRSGRRAPTAAWRACSGVTVLRTPLDRSQVRRWYCGARPSGWPRRSRPIWPERNQSRVAPVAGRAPRATGSDAVPRAT